MPLGIFKRKTYGLSYIDAVMTSFDAVSARVMMVDNDLNIVAANRAVTKFLKTVQKDIQKDLPDFNASRLVGTNIDSFHKKPSHQRKLIAEMTDVYKTAISLGCMFLICKLPLCSPNKVLE